MSRGAFFFGLAVVALLIVSLYRAKYGAQDTAQELVVVEEAIIEATAEKAQLETELAHLSQRSFIEDYARNELGMAPPRSDQMAAESDLDLLIGPPMELGDLRRAREAAPVSDGGAP